MMDLNKGLRTATKTGKVHFGIAQAKKAIESKEGRLIVVATNCPSADDLKDQNNIPVIDFPGTNRELGSACGKPFAISVVTVVQPGDSQILNP